LRRRWREHICVYCLLGQQFEQFEQFEQFRQLKQLKQFE
tara:strand:+ start:138 stop:254 length:117 start_codon:yes stop_codon:yes gene_type:complete